MVGVHLSRMAEALILYSTLEFGFVQLADAFSTGSSLMPQKKNPDALELVRGKTGTLIGRLCGLLATLKGLPSAYDKDLQEDKQPVFEAADTLGLALPVMSGVIYTLTVYPKKMKQTIHPQMLATDLADYLVKRGVPFRQAHSAVGKAVKRAEELGVKLSELSINEWQAIHPAFKADLQASFDLEAALMARNVFGGTGPDAVLEQLSAARKLLSAYPAAK